MFGMGVPVGRVFGCEVWAANDQEVFGIGIFRRLGEIERPRNDGLAVDHHDLVMGNGVLGVDLDRDARIMNEIRRRVFLALLAFIQNDFDLHPSLVGID